MLGERRVSALFRQLWWIRKGDDLVGLEDGWKCYRCLIYEGVHELQFVFDCIRAFPPSSLQDI